VSVVYLYGIIKDAMFNYREFKDEAAKLAASSLRGLLRDQGLALTLGKGQESYQGR